MTTSIDDLICKAHRVIEFYSGPDPGCGQEAVIVARAFLASHEHWEELALQLGQARAEAAAADLRVLKERDQMLGLIESFVKEQETLLTRAITDRGEHMGQWRFIFDGPNVGGIHRTHTAPTWEEAAAKFRAVWMASELEQGDAT